MPTPKPVSKRLREMLGGEAAEAMIDYLDNLDHRDDLIREAVRAGVEPFRAETRSEIATLKAETGALRAETAALREETVALHADIAELRHHMNAQFAAVDARFVSLESKFDGRFDALRAELAAQHASLMKWMLTFWLASFGGIIAAILSLARLAAK